MSTITTYHLALKLDSDNELLDEWKDDDGDLYLKISNISEDHSKIYNLTFDIEINHPIFGFPLEHIKVGHLFIIKETTKPGSQEFKITPSYPDTYHLLLNNEEVKQQINLWKKWNMSSEKIKSIENLKWILRDIQLDKLI